MGLAECIPLNVPYSSQALFWVDTVCTSLSAGSIALLLKFLAHICACYDVFMLREVRIDGSSYTNNSRNKNSDPLSWSM